MSVKSNKLVLIICGSRIWTDKQLVLQKVKEQSAKIKLIIEGGARGADTFAKQAAELYNIPSVQIDAEWDLYGKRAGYLRNKKMLDYLTEYNNKGYHCEVWAFTNDLENSKGTRMMVDIAKKARYTVKVYNEEA